MYILFSKLTEKDFSFEIIIIFFVINSILDQIPITPKNLGLGELVFGYSSVEIGLSFEFGVALKLLLRILYFVYLFFSFTVTNIIYYKKDIFRFYNLIFR